MDHIVEIQNLTKDYEVGFWKKRKVRALDGLTLAVEPGQIFGFLGGNGAGKTTTLKILMGLLFPTEGSAKILGRDISDVEMRRRIGYCPESPYFYDYLTAAELMDYFGQLFGYDASVRKAKSADLLTRAGLPEKDWNKQLRKFSKGMQQRVGLAQALINDPEIVFLDEPMSGLDPVGRREIRELISSLRDRGTTVFMSTHILSDVEALCDNVAVLRGGKLSATGKLSELLVQSEGDRAFEIMVSGVGHEAIQHEIASINGCRVSSKPGGISIEVPSESDIDPVLAAVRQLNGSLISVNPVKQSLEELFVETAAG
ncbi:MAG: ABC transporter ATP-binding protein [Pyrinomonadaceae bacterium]|nr:ABC transporter ATP-binding protein [Pyrinomonadaceae bacterium]